MPETEMIVHSSQFLVPVYLAYSAIAVALTVWLARTLFKNGQGFLRDVFKDQPDLSDAVNRLLVVGFYLVNLGYAALMLKAEGAGTRVEALETLSMKLGLLLLSLAVMHFANMLVFHKIRQRALHGEISAPVPPTGYLRDEYEAADLARDLHEDAVSQGAVEVLAGS